MPPMPSCYAQGELHHNTYAELEKDATEVAGFEIRSELRVFSFPYT
jgi:predicted RNase H-like HicB family nuclease